MTVAQFDLQRIWGATFDSGASQHLNGLVYRQKPPAQLDAYFGYTGTSGSAQTIQHYLNHMFEQTSFWEKATERWLEAQPDEVIVLMPPKKQYAVDVQITYLGRAQPLIQIDDMDIEID